MGPRLFVATGADTSVDPEAVGLTFRPIADTVQALLDWYPREIECRVRVTRELVEQAKARGQPPPKGDPSTLRAGPPGEQDLLARWKTAGCGTIGASGKVTRTVHHAAGCDRRGVGVSVEPPALVTAPRRWSEPGPSAAAAAPPGVIDRGR